MIENISKSDVKLFAVETDVTKEEDVLRAFAYTEKNVGPIDVMINCAGSGYTSLISQFDTDSLKRVLNTNLVATSVFTREAIKSMQANKIDGTIINICSLCGHVVPNFPGVSVYAASKFGVRAFTEAIRQELASSGSKIRITVRNYYIILSLCIYLYQ